MPEVDAIRHEGRIPRSRLARMVLARVATARTGSGRSALPRLAALLILLWAAPAAAQRIDFTTDFETGNLAGWQQYGDAFRYQPTRGDNPTARQRGQPSKHQGDWWIGTFERYQGRRGERPGAVQGDRPTGYLQSREFTIPAGSLTFLVGGGAAFETRVELVVLNQGGDVEFRENRVYHASGRNNETMQPVTWNLDPYAGARGFIRIVDNAAGPWGHINADYFRFVPRLQMMQPMEVAPVAPTVLEPVRPTTVSVPDLRGRTLRQAMEIAKEAGLGIRDVEMVEPGYREGTVIRQAPEPGTQLPRGGGIVLVLGPRPQARVPDLRGMILPQARELLVKAGLEIENVETVEPGYLEGAVIRQAPEPGTQLPRGGGVILVLGPRPRVSVPGVVGMEIERAARTLERSRLRQGEVIERESRRERPGTVIGQDPPAGAEVAPGSAVTMVVAVAPPVVLVPDLGGLTVTEAETALGEAELALGEVSTVESMAPEKRIVRQAPARGERVEPGTAVNVYVAVRTRVEVPRLLGRQRREVDPILTGSNLVLDGVSERPSERGTGTVLAQDPQPGSVVVAGSGVQIVVASAPPPVIDEPPAEDEPLAEAEPPTVVEPPVDEAPEVVEPPVDEPPQSIDEPPAVAEPAPGGQPRIPDWRRFADPIWIGVVVAALVLGSLTTHLLHRRAARRTREDRAGQGDVTFRPRPDTGRSTIDSGTSPHPEFELRLRPNRDPGEQRIEGAADPTQTPGDEP